MGRVGGGLRGREGGCVHGREKNKNPPLKARAARVPQLTRAGLTLLQVFVIAGALCGGYQNVVGVLKEKACHV
ncbi:hypothetical protein chiPu_0025578 [Chiloscyllium punctatum]|uniref:Uncharacterized protein n=1 Tax=Chiloscyllium punctatum TaxID=137246 RepID=A0A401TGA6_CHIPU|nr:hypothetical protein [Chiloscyllium punctatum]